MDRFGENRNFQHVVFVIYSGIHYDAIALTPSLESPKEFDQTTFENNDSIFEIFEAVSKIQQVWKRKHKFTDVANFTLKCGICGIGIKVFYEEFNSFIGTKRSSVTLYTNWSYLVY